MDRSRIPLPTAPVLAVFVVSLWACQRSLDPPAPPVQVTADSLPPLPPSMLYLPVLYDPGPAIGLLETAVPRRFGDLEARQPSYRDPRLTVAFAADRDSLLVSLAGPTVYLTAFIRYQARGWYDVGDLPDATFSCGVKQAPPRARIQLVTTVEVKPGWALVPKTAVVRVEPYSPELRDRCRVSALHIDVTERILDGVRHTLASGAVQLDGRIETIDIRAPLQRWWHLLQSPIRLTDGVWLLLNPSSIRLAPIAGNTARLETRLGLAAYPRIVTGDQPDTRLTPLPRISAGPVGDGLDLTLEGAVDYRLMSDLLRRQLRGARIARGPHVLRIEDVAISGLGDGLVAVELRFVARTGGLFSLHRTTHGRVYFVGTPKYDPESDAILIPDLEYDVATENLLVSGYDWMNHGEVRDFFRRRARWPVQPLLHRGRQLFLEGINRPVAPGVQLQGSLASSRALGVYATHGAILLRAEAHGQARLIIRHPPDLSLAH